MGVKREYSGLDNIGCYWHGCVGRAGHCAVGYRCL